jgi:hypothetical protein
MNIYHVGDGWKPGDDILSLGAADPPWLHVLGRSRRHSRRSLARGPDYLLPRTPNKSLPCHARRGEELRV